MEDRKLRFWESLVILGSIALYVYRFLSKIRWRFDEDFANLLNYGADITILDDYKADFFKIENLELPIYGAAILFYFSWVVLHFLAFPKLKNYPKEFLTYVYLVIGILLVFSGVYFHQINRHYWSIGVDKYDNPSGFGIYHKTRNIHLFSETVVILWLIFLYEILSYIFYWLSGIFRKEGFMYGLIINFMFAVSLLTCVITFSELGNYFPSPIYNPKFLSALILGVPLVITQKVIFNAMKGENGLNQILGALFIGLTISFISEVFLQIILCSVKYLDQSIIIRLQRKLSDISIVTLLLTFAAFCIAGVRYLGYRQKNKLQTQVSVKSAELDQLRAQVNPHFLFNALNTLYSISLKEGAETTANGIQKLGDMMRFMLNENHQDFISLEKEIEQLENYILIQRMRLDETQDIKINVNISHPDKEIHIAPMLLNPFVENAFKHGISFRNPSWIHITLTFDDKKLYFKVHNSLHQSKEIDPEKYNNGIGMTNVKKRLELLYPEKHQLLIEESDHDFFVSLTINY